MGARFLTRQLEVMYRVNYLDPVCCLNYQNFFLDHPKFARLISQGTDNKIWVWKWSQSSQTFLTIQNDKLKWKLQLKSEYRTHSYERNYSVRYSNGTAFEWFRLFDHFIWRSVRKKEFLSGFCIMSWIPNIWKFKFFPPSKLWTCLVFR